MIQLQNNIDCCGCGACMSICPKACINMVRDSEGFEYPSVNEDACVHCNLCDNVCPIKNKRNYGKEECGLIGFVTKIKDENKRQKSTSGGFFRALAESVLKDGGIVYGVKWDRDYLPIHSCVESIGDLDAFCRSKYVQSSTAKTFKDVKMYLNNRKIVLFSGTPCQVAGLKNYLGKEYDNLMCCDVVCRGTISPALWKKQLTELENSFASSINYIGFREKLDGFHKTRLVIKMNNGKVYAPSTDVEWISRFFSDGICLRPSCYECHFKGIERASDFTMFDCWNITRLVPSATDDDGGYTTILVRSAAGRKWLNRISDNIDCWQVDYEKAIEYDGIMVNNCVNIPQNRDVFFEDMHNLSMDSLGKKYSPISFKIMIKEYIKNIWRSLR